MNGVATPFSLRRAPEAGDLAQITDLNTTPQDRGQVNKVHRGLGPTPRSQETISVVGAVLPPHAVGIDYFLTRLLWRIRQQQAHLWLCRRRTALPVAIIGQQLPDRLGPATALVVGYGTHILENPGVMPLDSTGVELRMARVPVVWIQRGLQQPAVGRAAAADGRGTQRSQAPVRPQFEHPRLVQAHAPAPRMHGAKQVGKRLSTIWQRSPSLNAHGSHWQGISPGSALQHQHPLSGPGQTVGHDTAAKTAADDNNIEI